MYYVLNLRKINLIKGDELSTECGNWWECSGKELWVMNLRRSNFVAQSDKCDRRGGNRALKKSKSLSFVSNGEFLKSGGVKRNDKNMMKGNDGIPSHHRS